MSKPVEIEFLMKDKLTPGMDKAEREALELRNTVRLLRLNWKGCALPVRQPPPTWTNVRTSHRLTRWKRLLRSCVPG